MCMLLHNLKIDLQYKELLSTCTHHLYGILTDGSPHFYRTFPNFGWSQCPICQCLVQPQQGTTGFGIQAILLTSERRMVKYFCNNTDISSTWDHVVSAFWQRYPNPFRYCNMFSWSVVFLIYSRCLLGLIWLVSKGLTLLNIFQNLVNPNIHLEDIRHRRDIASHL